MINEKEPPMYENDITGRRWLAIQWDGTQEGAHVVSAWFGAAATVRFGALERVPPIPVLTVAGRGTTVEARPDWWILAEPETRRPFLAVSKERFIALYTRVSP